MITYKDRPSTVNMKALDKISASLSKAKMHLVLVHGGGSYGHYFASKYGLTMRDSKALPEGVSRTRLAMLELNLKVLYSLVKHGFNPFPLSPSLISRTPRRLGDYIYTLVARGLTPVTYGDVLMGRSGFYVLSGDKIARILSEVLKPERVIFLMDVDGIFEDVNKPSSLIQELRPENLVKVRSTEVKADVTGGIGFKLKEAVGIARRGVDVFFIDGREPKRIMRALKGMKVRGTIIRGMRG